jgi:hypothetical protein
LKVMALLIRWVAIRASNTLWLGMKIAWTSSKIKNKKILTIKLTRKKFKLMTKALNKKTENTWNKSLQTKSSYRQLSTFLLRKSFQSWNQQSLKSNCQPFTLPLCPYRSQILCSLFFSFMKKKRNTWSTWRSIRKKFIRRKWGEGRYFKTRREKLNLRMQSVRSALMETTLMTIWLFFVRRVTSVCTKDVLAWQKSLHKVGYAMFVQPLDLQVSICHARYAT